MSPPLPSLSEQNFLSKLILILFNPLVQESVDMFINSSLLQAKLDQIYFTYIFSSLLTQGEYEEG